MIDISGFIKVELTRGVYQIIRKISVVGSREKRKIWVDWFLVSQISSTK